MRRARSGFALIFTLWVIIGCGSLAMTASLLGRDEIAAIQNRISLDRARWSAVGCANRFRAGAEAATWPEGFTALSVRAAWDSLDALPLARDTECTVNIRPAGLALNVNTATADQLRRLLLTSGMYHTLADSIVHAIVDWRDADDRPEPHGAERTWYVANGRIPPRNGPLASTNELALVRGVTGDLIDRALLGVRPERILWRRASRPVLAALPGMTDEALSVLASRGLSRVSDLAALGSFPEMSAASRDSLARGARDLMQLTTSTPEQWIIGSEVHSGTPAVRFIVISRYVLGDGRLIQVERRFEP